MKKDNMNKFWIYIRYPYTAAIIGVMWFSMAVIIYKEHGNNLEILISLTAICTFFIAYKGFKTIK